MLEEHGRAEHSVRVAVFKTNRAANSEFRWSTWFPSVLFLVDWFGGQDRIHLVGLRIKNLRFDLRMHPIQIYHRLPSRFLAQCFVGRKGSLCHIIEAVVRCRCAFVLLHYFIPMNGESTAFCQ